MKQNTKRYVKISLILYIVILAVAVVGTLAWFIYDRSAGISTGEDAKITAGQNLEICIDDGDDDDSNDVWGSAITLDTIKNCPDVSYDPVKNEWWYPSSLDENDEIDLSRPDTFEKIDDGKGYYITVPLKVRTTAELSVYLHEGSYVSGVDMSKTDDTKTGTFSKDAIAGAARVGFWAVDGDGNSALKTVWVPNASYQLLFTDGEVSGFNPAGEPEQSYIYVCENSDGSEMAEGVWNDSLISDSAEHLASDTETRDATPIVSFEKSGTPTVKKIVIRIWVEGTDRESNTACSGGEFNYNIQLVGILKSESTLSVDDVVYDGGQLVYSSTGEVAGSELLYSYNSRDWAQYSATNPDLAKNNTVLYIRAAETATERCGPVKEISLIA